MSIAVSAVIVPSRRLRWLLALFCAALCGAAVAMVFPHPERFAWDGASACAPLLAAVGVARAARAFAAAATARRIDISGVGQLRLTVQQGMEGAATTLTLLPGATVWPGCMLLRLRGEDGLVRPLLLMPDSVSAGEYRALAVAVRTLASGAGALGAGQAPGAASLGGLPPQIL